MRLAMGWKRMRFSSHPFTSVTRWLIVVVGCAVLETAQLMRAQAAAPEGSPARAPETVIYPQGGADQAEPGTPAGRGGSRSWSLLVAALALGGAGAWFLIKRRTAGLHGIAKGERKIAIEETRSLGNRQYLVVADYEGSKFLIGVTPGQIQMLAPLKAPQKSS